MSLDEVTRLFQAAGSLKYQAALGVAYGAGLRADEVVHLKVTDIDSERMIIRVEQGKGKRDRQAMLSPALLTICVPGGGRAGASASCSPVVGCSPDRTR